MCTGCVQTTGEIVIYTCEIIILIVTKIREVFVIDLFKEAI